MTNNNEVRERHGGEDEQTRCHYTVNRVTILVILKMTIGFEL